MVLQKLKTPSVFVILAIVLFSLFTFKYWIWWENNPFSNDVDQYYSYLVAQFIHHDLSFHFPHVYWLVPTPAGTLVPKVTMGIALLNVPFFILADNLAYIFNLGDNGYTPVYAWCIHFGAIIYVLTGIWYLRKTLLLFFSEWVTALTILCIMFATNLFYYTYRETEMSHSYLFFLFAVFLFHVVKWHHTQKSRHFFSFCFIAGFITLIRPTEILVLLIPLLYQVTSFTTLKLKLRSFLGLKWKFLLGVFLFFLPILPQLIYWKLYAGQFLFFSYGSEEGFFFSDPKLYSVLLGWRKGWFIYTPMMLFAVIGLAFMAKRWKNMFWPIFIYLCINIYLISSWWDWGFGGAFGMRALVQTYSFMAIPLAFFLQTLSSLNVNLILKRMLVFLVAIISCLFIYVNIFQTYLLKNAYMHWDSMTKEAYWYSLTETNIDRVKLETLFVHPDYQEMRKGKRDE